MRYYYFFETFTCAIYITITGTIYIKTTLSGNWDVPLDQFIAQTSDPIYWSVIAIALMKTMLKEVKSDISEQDNATIKNRIGKLGELSHLFISKAYAVDQDQTVRLLKEARIGGHSIIGKSLTWTSSIILGFYW